jgi:hypothetical protein
LKTLPLAQVFLRIKAAFLIKNSFTIKAVLLYDEACDKYDEKFDCAQRRSAAASAVFAARIQQHLDRCGVSLRDLAWQTDNGSEFIGGTDLQGRRTGFPAALGPSQHTRIPPAAHTYQSDVETVHRLVEDEFFDLETFANRGDFLAKTHTYQLYFNLVRPNSHKENLSPWQIIERLAPRSPLELCLLPPVLLDYYLNDSGGYDVPRYP